jgi:RNA polymerase sigma-70 factor (ECF subfamily)
MRGATADPGADIAELYAGEGPKLWRAVFAFAHDREVTDDAVAEAFAQCIRRGGAIRDPRAWVWRSAFRIAAGELQHRRRRFEADLSEMTYELPEEALPLLRVLRQLPANQRAAVVLRHYAGYGTDEIASILGSGRATVRVHLSRGRKRLRKLLDEEERTDA